MRSAIAPEVKQEILEKVKKKESLVQQFKKR
mgnify:CR=1 FL=1